MVCAVCISIFFGFISGRFHFCMFGLSQLKHVQEGGQLLKSRRVWQYLGLSIEIPFITPIYEFKERSKSDTHIYSGETGTRPIVPFHHVCSIHG